MICVRCRGWISVTPADPVVALAAGAHHYECARARWRAEAEAGAARREATRAGRSARMRARMVAVASDASVVVADACLGTPLCHGRTPDEHVPSCPLFAGGAP